MKKIAKLFSLATALFLFTTVLAQKINVPGYYIDVKGDTVKGVFTSYAQWSRNPSQVEFAGAASSRPILLMPSTCRKFVVEGYDEYLSFTGQRMLNPIEDADVIKDRAYSSYTDEYADVTAFLRLITRTAGGELYAYNDGKRINFYYRLPGAQLTELKYKKYYDQERINEIPEYKQQLNNLFAELIERNRLTRTLENLPYKEEELESFFERLFPEQQIKPKLERGAAGWFLFAGATLNQIQTSGDKNAVPVGKAYGSSFSPLLSMGYYLPLHRDFGRYFFFPQFKLFRYKSSGEQNDGVFINSTTYQAHLVVTGEVQGGVNIINQERKRFYLAGGLGLMGQLKGMEIQSLYAASNGSLYASSQAKLLPFTYTLHASAGVILNHRFMFSATYLVPSVISPNPSYTIKLAGAQLRLGYRLQ